MLTSSCQGLFLHQNRHTESLQFCICAAPILFAVDHLAKCNQLKQSGHKPFFHHTNGSTFPSMIFRSTPRLKSTIGLIIFSSLAGFFWWLFYERYYRYKDCIETAASSCLNAQGDNLIGAGMVWALPAFIFSGIAVYYLWRVIGRCCANKP